jgi:hypothetical protein
VKKPLLTSSPERPGRAVASFGTNVSLVEYHFFSDAGQAEEWNVDPSLYDDTLHSFLLAKVNGPSALGSWPEGALKSP